MQVLQKGCMEVTGRLHGGYMEIAWRLQGAVHAQPPLSVNEAVCLSAGCAEYVCFLVSFVAVCVWLGGVSAMIGPNLSASYRPNPAPLPPPPLPGDLPSQ